MDAAEFVVAVDDRMALAALALDSLSDAVSDASLLAFIATLDAQAGDVPLLLQAGHELLQAVLVLQAPQESGRQLGSLVDAVADVERLERTVLRNDEVCVLL